ncbi:MAG: hypothetical protein EP330_14605 [Deltaproteobacteria bacterium]|nr:MAG: hypothetical protein EP330_14605 [Deltaproteobacteria bacterium]
MNPLTWIAILSIAGVIFASAAFSLRAQRRCPACRANLVELPKPEDRTYEVMACPHCPTAVTLAVGHRARFSWCPTCKQRALQTPCIRKPSDSGALVVEVHEQCHVCGHNAVVSVEGPAPPRGLVVPFPTRDKRRAGGDG